MRKPSHITVTCAFGLLASLMFAVSDATIKFVSIDLGTLQVASISALVSLMFIFGHITHQGDLGHLIPRKPAVMALRSALKLIHFPCMIYAFGNIPLTQVYAALLFIPLGSSALSSLVLNESLSPRHIAALGLGLLGVIIALNIDRSAVGLDHLALVGICLIGSIDSIIVRYTAAHERLSIMGLWPTISVAIVMLSLSIADWQSPTFVELVAFVCMGLIGFTGGIAYTHAIRRGPMAHATAMQYSQIIWGGLIGFFVFGELVTNHVYVGSALIVMSGFLLVTVRKAKPAP